MDIEAIKNLKLKTFADLERMNTPEVWKFLSEKARNVYKNQNSEYNDPDVIDIGLQALDYIYGDAEKYFDDCFDEEFYGNMIAIMSGEENPYKKMTFRDDKILVKAVKEAIDKRFPHKIETIEEKMDFLELKRVLSATLGPVLGGPYESGRQFVVRGNFGVSADRWKYWIVPKIMGTLKDTLPELERSSFAPNRKDKFTYLSGDGYARDDKVAYLTEFNKMSMDDWKIVRDLEERTADYCKKELLALYYRTGFSSKPLTYITANEKNLLVLFMNPNQLISPLVSSGYDSEKPQYLPDTRGFIIPINRKTLANLENAMRTERDKIFEWVDPGHTVQKLHVHKYISDSTLEQGAKSLLAALDEAKTNDRFEDDDKRKEQKVLVSENYIIYEKRRMEFDAVQKEFEKTFPNIDFIRTADFTFKGENLTINALYDRWHAEKEIVIIDVKRSPSGYSCISCPQLVSGTMGKHDITPLLEYADYFLHWDEAVKGDSGMIPEGPLLLQELNATYPDKEFTACMHGSDRCIIASKDDKMLISIEPKEYCTYVYYKHDTIRNSLDVNRNVSDICWNIALQFKECMNEFEWEHDVDFMIKELENAYPDIQWSAHYYNGFYTGGECYIDGLRGVRGNETLIEMQIKDDDEIKFCNHLDDGPHDGKDPRNTLMSVSLKFRRNADNGKSNLNEHIQDVKEIVDTLINNKTKNLTLPIKDDIGTLEEMSNSNAENSSKLQNRISSNVRGKNNKHDRGGR